MFNPYIGSIFLFAGNFAPAGWAFCHGQLLPISEYEALFNIIGTTYGGDGQETFALPDYRGRVIVGTSGTRALGEQKDYPAAAEGQNQQHSLGLNYIISLQGVFPSPS